MKRLLNLIGIVSRKKSDKLDMLILDAVTLQFA